jgi:hypothetical protein
VEGKKDPVWTYKGIEFFGQKKLGRGVMGKGISPMLTPSPHSLAQGGEGGEDYVVYFDIAKKVPSKIRIFLFFEKRMKK